jgi:ketosteroid isomerase-like protein
VIDVGTLAGAFCDAWNANDWDALEALCEEGVVVVAPEGWPESGEFAGWPAVRAQFERLKEPFEDERIQILDYTPLDEDAVVTHNRWRGHGASGFEVDFETWTITRFRGGRIARIEFHLAEDRVHASLDAG